MPSALPDTVSSWRALFASFLWLLGLGLLPAAGHAAGGDRPETIAAMQERYADEIRAHQQYGAYARHALEEGYPNIAHLFRALAHSEAIHARNFGRVLEQLGAKPEAPELDVQLTTTRDHLEKATAIEADEIDVQYPSVLARLQSEGHQAAIDNTTWAWQAEKQHRDLIIKIRDVASTWFGLLVSRIEGEPRHYHVCQICGSTLDEPPVAMCPICRHPAAHYQEVPWQPGAERKPEPSAWDTGY